MSETSEENQNKKESTPEMANPMPRRWQLLKQDGKLSEQPLYYSMAYDDTKQWFIFYITDFINVWREIVDGDRVVKVSAMNNYILNTEDDISKMVSVLGSCLFNIDESPDNLTSDFILLKSNPKQEPCPDLYLGLRVSNGFKWDFNLHILDHNRAALIIKYLVFSLFNISNRLQLQMNSLVQIINEKDKAIKTLCDVAHSARKSSEIQKYVQSSDSRKAALCEFGFELWQDHWNNEKNNGDLKPENNNIWNVIDNISGDYKLWKNASLYHSNVYEENHPGIFQKFKSKSHDDFEESFVEKPIPPSPKQQEQSQTPMDSPISPRKRTFREHVEEKPNIEHLSQSFHESVDINANSKDDDTDVDENDDVVKTPSAHPVLNSSPKKKVFKHKKLTPGNIKKRARKFNHITPIKAPKLERND